MATVVLAGSLLECKRLVKHNLSLKPNQKQLRYAICIFCVFTIMYEIQNLIFCLVLLVLCHHNHLNDLTDSWFGWPSPTFFVICILTEFCSVFIIYIFIFNSIPCLSAEISQNVLPM